MTWLYLVVMIFSALTLYFTYGEYKQNRFSKRAFTLVSILEAVVIVATAVMLIMSLWPIPIWRIEAIIMQCSRATIYRYIGIVESTNGWFCILNESIRNWLMCCKIDLVFCLLSWSSTRPSEGLMMLNNVCLCLICKKATGGLAGGLRTERRVPPMCSTLFCLYPSAGLGSGL